jgi:hypothetical protein
MWFSIKVLNKYQNKNKNKKTHKQIKKKQKKQELENKIIRLANAMGYTKGSQISQTRFISDSKKNEALC